MAAMASDKGKGALNEEEEREVFRKKAQADARVALKAGQTEDAVSLFGEALQLSVEQHGELAFACVESYCEYGRALLQRAQECTDVFGDKQVSKLAAEPASAAADGNAKGGEDADDADDAEEEVDNDEDEDDEGEEDDSDLGLAWSMFDLCRVIYEKKIYEEQSSGGAGLAADLAEVHQLLGDVKMEQEKFEESVAEYDRALALITSDSSVGREDRRIAEVHYKTCLAYQFAERPADARKSCEAAIDIFKRRMAPGPGRQAALMSAAELKDHRGVLAELEMKLDEVKESEQAQQNTKAAIKAVLAGYMGAAPGGAPPPGAERIVATLKREIDVGAGEGPSSGPATVPQRGANLMEATCSAGFGGFDAPKLATSAAGGAGGGPQTAVFDLGVAVRSQKRKEAPILDANADAGGGADTDACDASEKAPKRFTLEPLAPA